MMLCKQTEVSFERLAALLSGTPARTLVTHHNLYLNYPLTRQPALPPIAQPVWDRNLRLRELTVFNLTYHYPGTHRGISGIDLKLVRGSLTVITGRRQDNAAAGAARIITPRGRCNLLEWLQG